MGKLNNYMGIFALATLGILIYKVFIVDKKVDEKAAAFLGRNK